MLLSMCDSFAIVLKMEAPELVTFGSNNKYSDMVNKISRNSRCAL